MNDFRFRKEAIQANRQWYGVGERNHAYPDHAAYSRTA